MHKCRTLRLVLFAVALSGCASAPFDYPRESSYAIDPETESALRTHSVAWSEEYGDLNGVYPLILGNDALGARLQLLEQSEHSIDAQYFLMKGDAAGRVFSAALLEAADRGVRIRFLLDDVFTTIEDEELLLIDAHPNIDVRLYNPISRRGFHALNFAGHFKRANRRMHNKSFIADNQVAILGGRNIADEYFELDSSGEFMDFDALLIGPAVHDVSIQFDSFWNHGRSLPIEALKHKFTEQELADARAAITEAELEDEYRIYEHAVNSRLLTQFRNSEIDLYPSIVQVMTDDPDKVDVPISKDQWKLIRELDEHLQNASSTILVLTPYLVPGKDGVEYWRRHVERGVRVIILTNSLASNNHVAVHSAYSGYRKDLLRAGVELLELRANAVENPEQGESVTLHTKAMLIDYQKLFVGSLNLDPRSIEINTEMGAIIHSDPLAQHMTNGVLEWLDTAAWRVELDDRGKLTWTSTINGVEVVQTSEPLASRWLRFKAWFLKIVPESQL